MKNVVAIGAVALVAMAGFDTSAHAQWTYSTLHPPTAATSEALGSSGGQHVGAAVIGGVGFAALWSGTAASPVNLQPSGADSSAAYGNFGGQQVGAARFTAPDLSVSTQAGLWNGSAATWNSLHQSGWYTSEAWGTNGTYQVGNALTEISGTPTYRPMLWNGAAASAIDLTPSVSGAKGGLATAISSSGSQQVGQVNFTSGAPRRAALWSSAAASFVDLNPAGSAYSFASGTNGTQQVGEADIGGEAHAILWNGAASSFFDLHPAGAAGSGAAAILGSQQVGYASFGDDGFEVPALWTGTAGSFVNLSAFLPSSFLSSRATGISTDGVNYYISGFGYYQDLTITDFVAVDYSASYAFVLTQPVPAPGAAALLGLGGLMASRRRRAANA